MIKLKYTGKKQGLLKGIEVVCQNKLQAKKLSQLSTYWKIDGNVLFGYGSKKDINNLQDVVNNINSIEALKFNKGKSGPCKILIPFNKYKIGDQISNRKITKIGSSFKPSYYQIRDNHIDPIIDKVCFAYFD